MALPRPRHPERVAIVAVVVVAVANLAYFGTKAEVRGTSGIKLPPTIRLVDPQPGERILPQSTITVDLDPRYAGQLAIDHLVIPEDQLTASSAGELVFEPKSGHDIRAFSPGDHTATVEYWPSTTPSFEDARSRHQLGTYTWAFKVG